MERNVNECKIQDGGHIGRRIATKIDRAPHLIHTIPSVKYEVDWPSTSQVMEQNGGHIGNRITTKIDRAPLLTHPAMPKKYEIN
jgi:hypothetical protein